MKFTKYLCVLIFVIALAGCGVYTFTGHGIGGVATIAVDPIQNQTTEFGLSDDLTDAIISKLLNDRTLSLSQKNSADAILTGAVVSISDSPLSYSSSEIVTEYQVKVTVNFALVIPDQTNPLWEGRIVADGSYPYSEGSLENRNAGIKTALDRIADDLINKLTSDW